MTARRADRPARATAALGLAAATTAALLLAPLPGTPEAAAELPYCEYKPPPGGNPQLMVATYESDCLPSPGECAQGLAPPHTVRRDEPRAYVRCTGGGGEIDHYQGGITEHLCGIEVVRNRVVISSHTNSYFDPNDCVAVLQSPTARRGARFHPGVSGDKGAVASVSPQASAVGIDVLAGGGNAVDAAVAMVFAVGVTSPDNCGLGGGGFMIARSPSGDVRALDFRETAPQAMTGPEDLFVGPLVDAHTGHRTVGVPGTVDGMLTALAELGTITRQEALAGAQSLAEGHRVSLDLANAYLEFARFGGIQENRLRTYPGSRVLLNNGLGWHPGALFVQRQLAENLAAVAEHGRAGFYDPTTHVGKLLVEEMERSRGFLPADSPAVKMNEAAGLMTGGDLERYRAQWRRPLRTSYRDHEVLALPAPDSGGVQLLEMLNILERFDLREARYGSVDWAHPLAEARKIAAADRDAYIGDPAFVEDFSKALASKRYGMSRSKEIGPTAQLNYEPGQLGGGTRTAGRGTGGAGTHTTHVSVIDRWGGAVAVTCTNEQVFGSAVVAEGTGFVLNNQLTDFSRRTDEGFDPNEPAPGKRPRSNMTPFLVVKDSRVLLAGGGAGGSMIPAAAAATIVNLVDFDMTPAEAVDAARVIADGRTWVEERGTSVESARLPGLAGALAARGHKVEQGFSHPGGQYFFLPIMQVVAQDAGGRRTAVSDPRAWTTGAAAQP